MQTAHAYIRISTDKQDESSQRQQISAHATAAGYVIDHWHTDHVSGAIPWRERGLAAALAACQPLDTILVSEISRIARSTIGVLGFLEAAAAANVSVVITQSKLILDNSIGGKIHVTILALCAEIERELLRARTKAALQARRDRGEHMGRPRGTTTISKIADRDTDINHLLQNKISIRGIARLLQCSPQTLSNYLKRRAARQAQLPQPSFLPPAFTNQPEQTT